jgi:hypothetical protein
LDDADKLYAEFRKRFQNHQPRHYPTN